MISIDTLKKILKPKEMKNILGGSGCTIRCQEDDDSISTFHANECDDDLNINFWCKDVTFLGCDC